ncbi:glycosyltransferase [Francisella philomiragia]|uniref:glycosyltransferase n=1 Tax=Francisella philomiragia TaxID=28110 RepID=UPI001C9DFD73|nr:glycosyltransferase [Francisella philomiragia]MBY7734785.1 glycosyltransferase [Francisella philomiragia]
MYDYVIVTHIPAFYKVNLYNQLAKKLNIFVIFLASNTNEKRADDFVGLDNVSFEYQVLFSGNLQQRNSSANIKRLRSILKSFQYKKILVSGWDLLEFWYVIFANRKNKNCLALESTVNESKTTGAQGLIKKIFLSRIATVFASGTIHRELLLQLGYRGDIKITKGVGIINKPSFNKEVREYHKKFLYVGRLSAIKNLERLVQVFNNLKDYSLTIIGEGEQREYLQKIASSNIIFKPAIDNKKLKNEFLSHDVFVLPSLVEPWGLVVEEAFYFGLPVIISQNCGARDIVKDNINGYWIDPENIDELISLIQTINSDKCHELITGVEKFSLNAKDIEQVEAYL